MSAASYDADGQGEIREERERDGAFRAHRLERSATQNDNESILATVTHLTRRQGAAGTGGRASGRQLYAQAASHRRALYLSVQSHCRRRLFDINRSSCRSQPFVMTRRSRARRQKEIDTIGGFYFAHSQR